MLVEHTAQPGRVVPLRAGGSERRLVTLHPALAGRYTALVAAVSPAVERELSPAVAANRISAASVEPPELRLRPWRSERRAFAGRLADLAASSRCVVFADVRDCYGSIPPVLVERSLTELGVDRSPAAEVRAFLHRLACLGVRGLPVGPQASAVLANAVLVRADRALEQLGVRHLRWVDDFVAAADGRRHAALILGSMRDALAAIGLELNRDKTRLVLDGTAAAHAPALSRGRARPAVG